MSLEFIPEAPFDPLKTNTNDLEFLMPARCSLVLIAKISIVLKYILFLYTHTD